MNPNLTIDETLDADAVWSVVSDASVLDRICDDHWTKLPREELRTIVSGIVNNPDNYVMLVKDGETPVGAILFYAKGGGTYEAHTMFTGRCRGADAIRMGKQITDYLLTLPGVKKLTSFCPDNLPETYLFARLVGWQRAGMAVGRWLKNGIEYPMKAVEITQAHWKGVTPCH